MCSLNIKKPLLEYPLHYTYIVYTVYCIGSSYLLFFFLNYAPVFNNDVNAIFVPVENIFMKNNGHTMNFNEVIFQRKLFKVFK